MALATIGLVLAGTTPTCVLLWNSETGISLTAPPAREGLLPPLLIGGTLGAASLIAATFIFRRDHGLWLVSLLRALRVGALLCAPGAILLSLYDDLSEWCTDPHNTFNSPVASCRNIGAGEQSLMSIALLSFLLAMLIGSPLAYLERLRVSAVAPGISGPVAVDTNRRGRGSTCVAAAGWGLGLVLVITTWWMWVLATVFLAVLAVSAFVPRFGARVLAWSGWSSLPGIGVVAGPQASGLLIALALGVVVVGESVAPRSPSSEIASASSLGPCRAADGLTLCVVSVDRNWQPPQGAQTPHPGLHYLRIGVTFSAQSGEHVVSRTDLLLRDPLGISQSPIFPPVYMLPDDCTLTSSRIAAGGQLLRATACFEVRGPPDGDYTLIWSIGYSKPEIPLSK